MTTCCFEDLRHLLPDHAGDEVVRPAGRERHDQPDRLRRKVLRERGRRTPARRTAMQIDRSTILIMADCSPASRFGRFTPCSTACASTLHGPPPAKQQVEERRNRSTDGEGAAVLDRIERFGGVADEDRRTPSVPRQTNAAHRVNSPSTSRTPPTQLDRSREPDLGKRLDHLPRRRSSGTRRCLREADICRSSKPAMMQSAR